MHPNRPVGGHTCRQSKHKGLITSAASCNVAGKLIRGAASCMETPPPSSLTLQPIGHLRTGKQVKFQALHQPKESDTEENRVELLPKMQFEGALRDLAGFSRIWLIWWFHRNQNWRPMVLPPRGPAKRRGVFATRSPHRPNPIGISPVQLLGVSGLTLRVGPCDLVEGTPILDIKPYLPAYDSFPHEKAGWWDDVEAALQATPSYTVTWAPLAIEQRAWLRSQWNVDFANRMLELLERDPHPHRSRRIRQRRSGAYEIGCGAWRGIYTIDNAQVTIASIEPAYPYHFLVDPARPGIPDCEAQLAFLALWPES